jgi:putative NADH-flavin reductase
MNAQKIVVVGGTGYAGSAIAREAATRGHSVTVIARNAPAEPIATVAYVATAVSDAKATLRDADVIVGAISPRGENTGTLVSTYGELARAAADAGARLVIIGGFSCLRRKAGLPPMILSEPLPPSLPPEVEIEARENLDVLNSLVADESGVDWLFVSPALEFSAWTPGADSGRYRIGDDVALFDEHGASAISGIDFARAILDEIETPTRHRAQIGVAY